MFLTTTAVDPNAILDAILAFGAIVIIGIIIGLLVYMCIQTLFLWLGLKIVKAPENGFGKAFGTTFLTFLMLIGLEIVGGVLIFFVTFLLENLIYMALVLGGFALLGLILTWLIISKRHDISFGKAFLAWFLSILIPLAISLIGFFVLGGAGYFLALLGM